MPEFHINICKPKYKMFWHQWQDEKNNDLSEEVQRLGESGALGRNVVIKARDLQEAVKLAKELNPDFAVMREGSHKLG